MMFGTKSRPLRHFLTTNMAVLSPRAMLNRRHLSKNETKKKGTINLHLQKRNVVKIYLKATLNSLLENGTRFLQFSADIMILQNLLSREGVLHQQHFNAEPFLITFEKNEKK